MKRLVAECRCCCGLGKFHHCGCGNAEHGGVSARFPLVFEKYLHNKNQMETMRTAGPEHELRPSVCSYKPTVDDADLAALVVRAQGHGRALLGRHDADGALAVGTLGDGVVVGVALRQRALGAAGVQGGLDGVLAVGLVLPRDEGRLRGARLEAAGEGDGLEEDDHVLLGGTLDGDGRGGAWTETRLTSITNSRLCNSWCRAESPQNRPRLVTHG